MQFFNEFIECMHKVLFIQEELKKKKHYCYLGTLSSTAISVLMCIPKEGSRNFKEITEELSLPKSTLTSVVRQLDKSGYIIQKVNDKDRRRKDLFLTEQGKAVQNEHDLAEKQIYSIFMGNLDMEEKKMLLSILRKGCDYIKL